MKKKYIKLGEPKINHTEFFGNQNFFVIEIRLANNGGKNSFAPIDLQTNKLDIFYTSNTYIFS